MKELVGVVSLLDEFHDTQVRHIWQALQKGCNWPGPEPEDIPHFSWHVAEAYPQEHLESALAELCARLAPFKVITGGLGIFCAEKPVLYIPLVKDPPLMKIHSQIWAILGKLGQGISPYYSPARWMPHITLAYNHLEPEFLSLLVKSLAYEPLEWVISIDNLVMFGHPTTEGNRPLIRFPFTVGRTPHA